MLFVPSFATSKAGPSTPSRKALNSNRQSGHRHGLPWSGNHDDRTPSRPGTSRLKRYAHPAAQGPPDSRNTHIQPPKDPRTRETRTSCRRGPRSPDNGRGGNSNSRREFEFPTGMQISLAQPPLAFIQLPNARSRLCFLTPGESFACSSPPAAPSGLEKQDSRASLPLDLWAQFCGPASAGRAKRLQLRSRIKMQAQLDGNQKHAPNRIET